MALTPCQKSELHAWRSCGWKLRDLAYAFRLSHEGVRYHLHGDDPKPDDRRAQPGDTFGMLTVIREGRRDRYGHRRVWCKCDCGNIKSFTPYNLTDGKSRSCGCMRVLDDRRLRLITINGRTQYLQAWLRETGIAYRCFCLRIAAGWSEQEALTRPRQWGRRLDGHEKRKAGTG